ncbi:MAG TPA: D-glycerate dehydrogenase [Chloroflexota bacterium]|nr:D-glycerate dehydrogenase [Chloroflexota bacterium]
MVETDLDEREETTVSMGKMKIYATMKPAPALLDRLQSACEVSYWDGEEATPHAVLLRDAAEAEATVGHYHWTAELMDKLPKLRLIANVGVGVDHVDVPAATARGIIVTNTPDVLTDTTADLTFTLLMSTARRVTEADRFIRARRWRPDGEDSTFLGRDVHHATLGIVGLGRIGSAVAERGALGFKMKVLYYDVVRREDLEQKFGYQFVDLDTLLAESDFVSLHMPSLPSTYHMIGAAQLAMMKPTAILVNAGRGALVDEKALIAALKEGSIAGAGLDVFEQEPTDPDNPLFKMENVVVAPHIGSATAATRYGMAQLGVENVVSFALGKGPLTPFNPEVLSNLKK